jgi:hypothetical protein
MRLSSPSKSGKAIEALGSDMTFARRAGGCRGGGELVRMTDDVGGDPGSAVLAAIWVIDRRDTEGVSGEEVLRLKVETSEGMVGDAERLSPVVVRLVVVLELRTLPALTDLIIPPETGSRTRGVVGDEPGERRGDEGLDGDCDGLVTDLRGGEEGETARRSGGEVARAAWELEVA